MPETKMIGLGEMRDKFAQLGEAPMQTRIGRKMVVAAGRIVKSEAKAVAQAKGLRRTGALIKNIAIKRDPQAPVGTVQYNLGVRHGQDLTKKQKKKSKLGIKGGRIVKQYEDDPYYWRFAEFGTKHQAATPFIGPALENKATDAVAAMGDALSAELAKIGKP
jgi:HK97 gp10 family phage protein